MGEKNDAFCAYMEKKDIFADFINGTVFGGRKAVMPEELEPARKRIMQKNRTAEEPGGAEDTGMWRRSGAGREATAYLRWKIRTNCIMPCPPDVWNMMHWNMRDS